MDEPNEFKNDIALVDLIKEMAKRNFTFRIEKDASPGGWLTFPNEFQFLPRELLDLEYLRERGVGLLDSYKCTPQADGSVLIEGGGDDWFYPDPALYDIPKYEFLLTLEMLKSPCLELVEEMELEEYCFFFTGELIFKQKTGISFNKKKIEYLGENKEDFNRLADQEKEQIYDQIYKALANDITSYCQSLVRDLDVEALKIEVCMGQQDAVFGLEDSWENVIRTKYWGDKRVLFDLGLLGE